MRGAGVPHRRGRAPHSAPQEPRTPAAVLQRQEEAALGQEQPHHREAHQEDQGTERDCEGKKHDKKLADEQDPPFPKGSRLWQDTGFQGYEPQGVTTFQPRKKPKDGELTPQEKEANRCISRVRVRVEHSIAGVKVFRIARDIHRNLKANFEDTLLETACGLHNLPADFPIEA